MRPFTDVLRDHRNGKLVEHLTERMAKLVEAVKETGKPGTLTLSLKIGPSKGDDDTFEVVPNIASKVPEKDLPKALFYADEDGNLVREPPKGGTLFAVDEVESDREARR